MYVGAATNAVVFALAAWLSRVEPVPAAAPEPSPTPGTVAGPAAWILPLVAFSGVTSFSYEVIWSRLLGHLLGGSVEAFSTMLASFLLGIALGSALASRDASLGAVLEAYQPGGRLAVAKRDQQLIAGCSGVVVVQPVITNVLGPEPG